MDILIKKAIIVDKTSPYHNKTADILIRNGNITEIGENIAAEDDIQRYAAEGLHVSAGWLDLRANFCDPGFEQKEDIDSGIAAAAQGGFTGVCIMPSTQPPIHSKSQVEYVKRKAAGKAVDIFPIGAISHNIEGGELAEMYDMYQSGAVAFSDDKKNVSHAGVMMRALMYAKNFDAPVFTFASDKSVNGKGMMNEGINSTLLGMKGMPGLAEEIAVARDLQLCEYCETGLHFTAVSTAKSVSLIREAKAKGLKVTADISVYSLAADDSALHDFDTNYKVKPPLRTQTDIEALKQGLLDGTIDAICSDHTPEDIENKAVEFEIAAFGITGLESAYGIIQKNTKDVLSVEQVIEKLSYGPRQVLKHPNSTIFVGGKANLTLFNPIAEWTFGEDHIKSKSRNTPFIGASLVGKPLAIYNNGQFVVCD